MLDGGEPTSWPIRTRRGARNFPDRQGGQPRANIRLDYARRSQPVFSGNVFFLENSESSIKLDYSHLQRVPALAWITRTALTFPSNLMLGYPMTRKRYLDGPARADRGA